MKKKVWETPKLMVLARSTPEEAVLTACKGGTKSTANSSSTTACLHSTCKSNCSTVGNS
jgi:hypothetical protein